jgi:hypothetical protein
MLLSGRRTLGNQAVDGRILENIFGKKVVRMETGYSKLSIGSNG